jgi:hypothetical protein
MLQYEILAITVDSENKNVNIAGLDIKTVERIQKANTKGRDINIDYLKCCSFNSIFITIDEFDKLKLKIGDKFISHKYDFESAFEHHYFYKEINDVDLELIIPALINRTNPETKGIDYDTIQKWWIAETRIYSVRDVNGQKSKRLIADKYYDWINSKLPDNIRISEMCENDDRVKVFTKGSQYSNFYLQHPKGDCYGILTGSHNIFSLVNFELTNND